MKCVRKLNAQYLQTHPIVSIPKTSKALNLSAPTVRKSIGHLTDLGILQETSGKQRNKLYIYGEYLKILSEGTEPL